MVFSSVITSHSCCCEFLRVDRGFGVGIPYVVGRRGGVYKMLIGMDRA